MAELSAEQKAALARNLAGLRARIAAACARAGRDPAAVGLVAVTKYTGPELAAALLELGQLDLGENRSDHLLALRDALPARPAARWHMVGHLQRNKAPRLVDALHALHSLDSLELARRLHERRAPHLPPLEVYLEVRLAEGEGRSGLEPAAVPAFLEELRGLSRLRPAGLMGLPPVGPDAEAARPHLRRLRLLRDALPGPPLPGLSMGMTDDLEVAVEEGSTVVRVGRALLSGVLAPA